MLPIIVFSYFRGAVMMQEKLFLCFLMPELRLIISPKDKGINGELTKVEQFFDTPLFSDENDQFAAEQMLKGSYGNQLLWKW